jgi:hypothetical protein
MELDGVNDTVSAESIYRYVYSPAGRRAGLPRYLAQRKAKRGRRRRNGRREPSIPNRVSIDQRPAEADGRIVFGHWEGDLMHFRRQQDILLTLHERCSRLTLAERLASKDATDTADAIIDQLAALPSTAVQTITHDNGGEFARHERVKDAIGLRAFFCDPHSHGSAAASRTPTAACGATCRARQASAATPTRTSTASSGTSTQRRENASASKHQSRPSHRNSVSHLKCESSHCLPLAIFRKSPSLAVAHRVLLSRPAILESPSTFSG